jgi:ATP-binding cassette subfamily C (CFTR/MRP) protein 10
MVLPGPQIDFTLKRVFVGVVWLDIVLALIAIAYHRPRRNQPVNTTSPTRQQALQPHQSPAFFVALVVVLLTTVMGAVFQLAIPVHARVPGSQLYLMDDWALHIGVALLSAISLWCYEWLPVPVRFLLVSVPALTEGLRLAFMVQTREAVVDPLQCSFDVLRCCAEVVAAVALLGFRWLLMMDIGAVVWQIGRRGWRLQVAVARMAAAATRAVTHVPSAAEDDDGENEPLTSERRDDAAAVVADVAAGTTTALATLATDADFVVRHGLRADTIIGVAAAERDLLDKWASARRAALRAAEGLAADSSDDDASMAWADGGGTSALQGALLPPSVFERGVTFVRSLWRRGRRVVKELFTLRTLRRDPVVQVLWARWGGRYIFLAVVKLTIDSLGLLTPVLLRVLMDSFTVPTKHYNERGCYAIVSALVVITLVAALCRAHCTLQLQRVAMHSRNLLSVAVFRHALALRRHQVSGVTSAGNIATHMTVDVSRITDQIPCFFDLWSLPFQAVLALYLLYKQVSFAFVAGLVITLVLIPVNMKLAKRIGIVNTALLSHNDERVLRVTEVLSNMKAVKMCGWSSVMQRWIAEPRAEYVQQLRWLKLLDAWCVFFWATTPIFVSLTTFAVYVWMGGDLTPGKAIAALSLFSTLITPLNAYPWVINGAVEANVSRRRLSLFLKDLEVTAAMMPAGCTARDDEETDTINIRGGLQAEKLSTEAGVMNPSSFAGREMAPSPPRGQDDDDYDARLAASTASERQRSTASSSPAAEEHVLVSAVDMLVMPALPPPAVLGDATATAPPTVPSKAPVRFELQVDSFLLRRGELLLVTGAPGSGKSTLLHAILGEAVEIPRGGAPSLPTAVPVPFTTETPAASVPVIPVPTLRLRTSGVTVAVVPQVPFLLPGTIRDNVLFGLVGSEDSDIEVRYAAALRAASLLADLTDMPLYDLTQVGERGTALSGGQRLRVMLARAYMANADVYILDDPLGSLDASVCRQIVANYILRLVRDEHKTVIVSTHRTEYFDNVSEVARVYTIADRRTAVISKDILRAATVEGTVVPEETTDARAGEGASTAIDTDPTAMKMKQGTLSWPAVRGYFELVGVVMCCLVLFFLLGMQLMRNVSDWYVAYWVAQGDKSDPQHFLNTLFALAVLNAVFAIGRSFLFAVAGLKAAQHTHDQLLTSVLRTTLSFFTDTSPGALINRLSKDVYCIDDSLPFTLNIVLAQFFMLVGAIVVIVFNSASAWVTVFVMAPAFLVYAVLQRPYRYATRAVKRVESEARSPVIDLLVQMIEGGAVIRASGENAMQQCLRRGFDALDILQRWNWNMAAFSAWFSLVLQLIGTSVLMAVAYAAVAFRAHSTSATAAAAGLSLAYVGPLSSYLNGLLGAYSELEKTLVSVERVYDFLNLPSEQQVDDQAAQRSHGAITERVPSAVVTMADDLVAADDGSVRFENVAMTYRDDGPRVLHDVSFRIRPGMKVAVVGRTGAGKSSLLAALLRLRPLASGRVVIGGEDTQAMPHDELRMRLGVLPQDAFIHHGTVRDNLVLALPDATDVTPTPSETSSSGGATPRRGTAAKKILDAAMRAALEDVGLVSVSLTFEVGENGDRLSAGQRQLVGIARLLLCSSPVIVLDEPNAALDAVTSARVDAAIRRRLADRTIIVVTHKLHGLEEHYDHVIVMHRGRVAEQGPPGDLLSRGKESALYRLMHGDEPAGAAETRRADEDGAALA